MATNDWMKTPHGYPRFESKTKSLMIVEQGLFVPYQKHLKPQWRVLVNDHPPKFQRHVDKTFDSKESAEVFARNYMRNHK